MGVKKLYQSKLAANGQLVLPKELRDALGLAGGDVVTIQAESQDNGVIEVSILVPRTGFRGLIGQWSSKTMANKDASDWNEDLKRLDDEDMK